MTSPHPTLLPFSNSISLHSTPSLHSSHTSLLPASGTCRLIPTSRPLHLMFHTPKISERHMPLLQISKFFKSHRLRLTQTILLKYQVPRPPSFSLSSSCFTFAYSPYDLNIICNVLRAGTCAVHLQYLEHSLTWLGTHYIFPE